MRNTTVLVFVLMFAVLTAVSADFLVQQSPNIKVQPKITMKAYSFDLSNVRLLDGPFREGMLRDQKYLLSLDADRLLHTFRVNAGLPSSAKPLGGWEAPDVELRGHSLGHYLSACALMYSSTGEEKLKAKADSMVAELAKIQQAMASRGFHAGYLSAFPEEFFDRVDAHKRVWAPYYTLHKIMAGLLDMYVLCNNQQALDVVVRLADWVKFRVDRLSDEQQQGALATEFGGMNDVLANLYAVTGNPEHLRMARKFDHRAVFDPLSRGEDPLTGLHANTQIPKAVGAAREYELTAEKRYYDIASLFWQRVAHQRSFVIGGNSDDEHFFPVEHTSKHLGAASTETCNTYNMLKLTRHLFAWSASAETMDFYERGLFNHILASQDPATGMMCYYVSLKPGAFKTFSTPEESFWCCVGTGMENHAKYPDTIYFHDDQSLYVNLFIPSELTWTEKKLVVRQETKFPEEETTRLTLKCEKPLKLALKIRYPSWAQAGMTLAINGQKETVEGKPGSYATVVREWKNGDAVEVGLPMNVRLEATPDDRKTVALLYGPIVLAGDLGNESMEQAKRYGPTAPQLGRVKPIDVPAFVCDLKDILANVKPVGITPLTFRTSGIGKPRDVTLVPFNRVFQSRYTVYWQVYSPDEWQRRKTEITAAEARRQEIESRTVDAVNVGEPQSEREHNFQGEKTEDGSFSGGKWREAPDGWFSYTLKVIPNKPLTLVCTYRGSEGRNRIFDVLVDGQKVRTETLEIHPTEVFDVEYPLSESLTNGKERVTVKFQAHPEAIAGAVLDVRIVPINPEKR